VQYPQYPAPHEGEIDVKKVLIITLATLCTTGANAQTPPTASQTGRLLASNCFQCHGTDGKTEDTFAKLAGKSSSEIFNELREMRVENKRGEIMTIHALGYTEAQLRAIADYFARQR
jgi:cytochrome c553